MEKHSGFKRFFSGFVFDMSNVYVQTKYKVVVVLLFFFCVPPKKNFKNIKSIKAIRG